MRSIVRCVRVGGVPRIISLATLILCSYVGISATPSDEANTVGADCGGVYYVMAIPILGGAADHAQGRHFEDGKSELGDANSVAPKANSHHEVVRSARHSADHAKNTRAVVQSDETLVTRVFARREGELRDQQLQKFRNRVVARVLFLPG